LNGTVLVARDRTGDREVWILVGANGEELAQDSYLCLSNYDDRVTIVDGTGAPECADAELEAFKYGSHVLTLWGLDGNDHMHGGAGRDVMYGGEGNDDLWGGIAGDDEHLHGGGGNDELWGSGGSNTDIVGAGGDDLLQDAGGGGTSLFGGGGRDTLNGGNCDDFRALDCGDGIDTLITQRVGTPASQGCETFEPTGSADFCD
jgi:Ca2+-binding RTX toxin-like protein